MSSFQAEKDAFDLADTGYRTRLQHQQLAVGCLAGLGFQYEGLRFRKHKRRPTSHHIDKETLGPSSDSLGLMGLGAQGKPPDLNAACMK